MVIIPLFPLCLPSIRVFQNSQFMAVQACSYQKVFRNFLNFQELFETVSDAKKLPAAAFQKVTSF